MPQREHTFVRDEILPSWWANALSAFLSTYAENFHLEQVPASNTQVRVPAGANDDLAAIAIDGRWRYVEANVVRAMAGGAGTYDVFVVAKDDVIVNVPLPNTDTTDRTFDLRFALTGNLPAAEPGVWALSRLVGQLDWDGAKITRFVQLVGDVGLGFGVRSFTIGDGIAKSFNLDHNMGTPDVLVEVYELAGNRVTSEFTVERPAGNDNRVTVSVDSVAVAAPGLNSLRVVIVARASQAAPVPAGHAASHLPGGSDVLSLIPLVTVLPAGPVDGQMCRFLADATAGVEWLLVYRAASASASKWEVIGGEPLSAQIDTAENAVGGGPADATTPGPLLVAPLAGEYDVTIEMTSFTTGASAMVVTLMVNLVAQVEVAQATSNANSHPYSVHKSRRRALAAADALRLRYGNSAALTLTVSMRRLTIRPVRVG